MGRGIILVRHARPEVERGVASRLWRLSERSCEDCVLLAHALPLGLAPVVFSSPEPKASQTANIIALRLGLQVEEDAAFAEVDRSTVWDDDYERVAASYLERGREGWEPSDSVVTRFTRGLNAAGDRFPDGNLVVTTHGLAMTLFLASAAGTDPVPFWQALTLPDAWRFEFESGRLERVFGITSERA